MRPPDHRLGHFSILAIFLACSVSIGILTAPSRGHAQNVATQRAASPSALAHSLNALPVAASHPAGSQDTGQAAPPAAAPSAPKPVELPEGDGKPIAAEYCQDCHRLTNLVKARKNLDDWKDTVQTMLDRGARLPDDKVDTLVKYLAKNFGPQDAAPASNAAAAPAATAPSSDAAASAATAAKPVELPEGDGKAIATENCQLCHKLTNLTKAHKSLDEWKDTVQTMIDRGANVPADKIDILVQYLTKNFGPTDAPASASSSPSSATRPQ